MIKEVKITNKDKIKTVKGMDAYNLIEDYLTTNIKNKLVRPSGWDLRDTISLYFVNDSLYSISFYRPGEGILCSTHVNTDKREGYSRSRLNTPLAKARDTYNEANSLMSYKEIYDNHILESKKYSNTED